MDIKSQFNLITKTLKEKHRLDFSSTISEPYYDTGYWILDIYVNDQRITVTIKQGGKYTIDIDDYFWTTDDVEKVISDIVLFAE